MNSALVDDGGLVPGEPAQDRLSPPATKVRARKALLYGGLGLAALLAAAAFGTHYWTVGRFIETTDDAYVGGDVTDLVPRVDGLIAQVAVTDNQFVHAGQLLLKIDDRDYRVALAKAAAEVAGDQASLKNLEASRVLQSQLIDEAEAELHSAQAARALAQANQSRYRMLAHEQAGSLQDSQSADANSAEADAEVVKAKAALAAENSRLTVIDTQTQQVQAALQGAQADLRGAELNIGYTEIRAPVDGVVGNRSAHVGGYATIGAQLISIVPANGLWVDANFKEDQLAHMAPGEPVTIVADVLPDAPITGRVGSLAPASGAVFSILPAENATGNFTKIVQRVPVRILLDGKAAELGLLRPGLSVTAHVNTKGAPTP
jgi:membrane fusion protein (multidrug efflux system)